MNYTQTLYEIYNLLCMYLPVDRFQRTAFISHFSALAVSQDFVLTLPTGQALASIDVYQFESPIIKPNPEFSFDFEPVRAAFKQYFATQQQAILLNSQFEAAEHNRRNQNELELSNLFGSSKHHKTGRVIDLKDIVPELTINFNDIKQSPNIPNLGRASL